MAYYILFYHVCINCSAYNNAVIWLNCTINRVLIVVRSIDINNYIYIPEPDVLKIVDGK